MTACVLMMISFEEMNEPVKVYGTRLKANKAMRQIKDLLKKLVREVMAHESERPPHQLNWMPASAKPHYDAVLALLPSQFSSEGSPLDGLVDMLGSIYHENIVDGLFHIVEVEADL